MKKLFILLILVAAFLLVVVLVILKQPFLKNQNFNQPVVNQNQNVNQVVTNQNQNINQLVDPTADWETYTRQYDYLRRYWGIFLNEEYKYKIRYPTILNPVGPCLGNDYSCVGSSFQYGEISISDLGVITIIPNQFQFEIVTYKHDQPFPVMVEKPVSEPFKIIDLGGVEAKEYFSIQKMNFLRGQDTGIIFYVYASTPEYNYYADAIGYLADREKIEKLFSQILSTFEFIK